MNHSFNDWLYYTILTNAAYSSKENKFFMDYDKLYQSDFLNYILESAGWQSKISINRAIKVFNESGYAEIGTQKFFGIIERGVFFKDILSDFYTSELNEKIIKKLLEINEKNCIKIYAYLLKKKQYKDSNDKQCFFTNKEIAKVLGYNAHRISKSVYDSIYNILTKLKENNLIDFYGSNFSSKKIITNI